MDVATFLGIVAANVVSMFVYDWLKKIFKDKD